jgi:hypothetical protein
VSPQHLFVEVRIPQWWRWLMAVACAMGWRRAALWLALHVPVKTREARHGH